MHHSSSSVIFERDIEPLLLPPSPSNPNKLLGPHRIPRARTTKQLESSAPSVLDSAAAALTKSTDTDIAIVAPLSPASSPTVVPAASRAHLVCGATDSDLLTSTPASTHTLSFLTISASNPLVLICVWPEPRELHRQDESVRGSGRA
ncbi:hypothetical protein DFP72DRAFT_1082053 [Ephemerocybe angulata]|uniref:Uncharacterized protein n=1 Tax=Ephemerocybe angulata TaxID=980116 RepID=A0A8H6H8B7_9AGAR|nr:hypothetical protein DFP72DRAFT_1082053 [Tulosesus angulatus]